MGILIGIGPYITEHRGRRPYAHYVLGSTRALRELDIVLSPQKEFVDNV